MLAKNCTWWRIHDRKWPLWRASCANLCQKTLGSPATWRRTWTSARVSRGVLCSRHARPALDYCRRRPNILGISSPLFVDYVQPLTEYLRQYHNSEGTCHVDDRLRWHLHGWDHCSQHCKYTPPNAGRMAWWPWIDDSDLGTLSELP